MNCAEPSIAIDSFTDPLLSVRELALMDDWWDSDRPDGHGNDQAAGITPTSSLLASMMTVKSSRDRNQRTQRANSKNKTLIWQSYNLPLPAALLEPQRWVVVPGSFEKSRLLLFVLMPFISPRQVLGIIKRASSKSIWLLPDSLRVGLVVRSLSSRRAGRSEC